MNLRPFVFALAFLAVTAAASAAPQDCPGRPGAIGVARTIAIDTSAGPIFGDITKATKEASFLGPKEVVLTFDDGPMPWITNAILDTLDAFCTKATFFSVGQMAIAYPETTKSVMLRGHTLATHTWSHPLNIARLAQARSVEEIEKGFAAVALAAGQPIAPFFRFPGLSDSGFLLDHLQKRGIAAFTVDVVSNDSYIADPRRLAQLTLQRIEQRQGGIVLFHDIKAATAKALPVVLTELVQRGYKVVHIKSRKPLDPVRTYDAELGQRLAKVEVAAGAKRPLVPFYGNADTLRREPADQGPVTIITAEARPRMTAAAAAHQAQAPAGRAQPALQKRIISPGDPAASEGAAGKRLRRTSGAAEPQ